MAFYLGGFSSGLFGGMHDAMSIMNEWEGVKQKRFETEHMQHLMEAGDAARKADAEGSAMAPNTKLPSVTDTGTPAGTGPIALHSGRDSNGRPDLSSVPLPNFMQPKKPAALLPAQGGVNSFERGSREGAPAGGTGSFERGSREGAPTPATTSSGTTAAAPVQEDPTAAAYGSAVSAPFKALGRGVAAVGRGALDLAGKVGQGMAVGEGQNLVTPSYLPPTVGGTAQVPQQQPRPAIGTPPTGYAGVAGQPGTPSGAAAPPGASPGLGQQQSPSLGAQIFNALTAGF